jgi:hypothetical protein
LTKLFLHTLHLKTLLSICKLTQPPPNQGGTILPQHSSSEIQLSVNEDHRCTLNLTNILGSSKSVPPDPCLDMLIVLYGWWQHPFVRIQARRQTRRTPPRSKRDDFCLEAGGNFLAGCVAKVIIAGLVGRSGGGRRSTTRGRT